jgi:hypothetical protein
LEYPIEIVKVLPYKPTYTQVLGYCLLSAVVCLVAHSRTFDRDIVNERDSDVGDLFLQGERNVAMHDLHCVGVAHWDSGESLGTKRGLERGQVVGPLVYCALVIRNEKVEYTIARLSPETLCVGLGDRGNSRIADGNLIEGL